MVKRYTLAYIAGATEPGFHDYVLASDYDALAARLAEAERLLREARSMLEQHVERSGHGLLTRIDAFLRPAEQETAND